MRTKPKLNLSQGQGAIDQINDTKRKALRDKALSTDTIKEFTEENRIWRGLKRFK
jgi:hypothetical protein